MNTINQALQESTTEIDGPNLEVIQYNWDSLRSGTSIHSESALTAAMVYGGSAMGLLSPGDYGDLMELAIRARNKLDASQKMPNALITLYETLAVAPEEKPPNKEEELWE